MLILRLSWNFLGFSSIPFWSQNGSKRLSESPKRAQEGPKTTSHGLFAIVFGHQVALANSFILLEQTYAHLETFLESPGVLFECVRVAPQ